MIDILDVNNLIKLHIPKNDVLKNEALDILQGKVYPVLNMLDNFENPIIFDVGANVGAFTAFSKLHIPKSKIYSFEPQKFLFGLMTKSFEDVPGIYLYNIGLAGENKDGLLYENKDFPYLGNSLYKVGESSEKICIKKISDIIKKLKIKKIDLIKIDTEGSEYFIIQDLVEHNIGFDVVCFEYHSDSFRRKIDLLLEKTHILVMFLCTAPHSGKAIYVSKNHERKLKYSSKNLAIDTYEL